MTHNGGSHLNFEYATIAFQREKPTFTQAIWAASVAIHPPSHASGQFGCRREYQHLHRNLLEMAILVAIHFVSTRLGWTLKVILAMR